MSIIIGKQWSYDFLKERVSKYLIAEEGAYHLRAKIISKAVDTFEDMTAENGFAMRWFPLSSSLVPYPSIWSKEFSNITGTIGNEKTFEMFHRLFEDLRDQAITIAIKEVKEWQT